jgi:hypothetical protein
VVDDLVDPTPPKILSRMARFDAATTRKEQ